MLEKSPQTKEKCVQTIGEKKMVQKFNLVKVSNECSHRNENSENSNEDIPRMFATEKMEKENGGTMVKDLALPHIIAFSFPKIT